MSLADAFKKHGITPDKFKKNDKKIKSTKPKKDNRNEKNENPSKNSRSNKLVTNFDEFKLDIPKNGSLRLKLTAISPIHIGSGEIYEPTNFVIDGNFLYYFRDEDFFENLNELKQQEFMNILNENRSDSFIRIHKFVKNNIEIAKKYSLFKVATSKGIQDFYNKKVGKVVNIESKNIRVFNQFEIQKVIRKQVKTKDKYVYAPYISGSSLKGAISTAYQEFISKIEGESSRKNKFDNKKVETNIFKYFKVSDGKISKISTKIGFAKNVERFEEDDSNMTTLIETIQPNSQFIVDINYNEVDIRGTDVFKIKDIFNSLNSHYLPIFKTLFDDDEYIKDNLDSDFIKTYQNFELKENQFLIRVGKHSGARAVTIKGAKIKVKESKFNTIEADEETTTWLFADSENSKKMLPFGWVLCEIIS